MITKEQEWKDFQERVKKINKERDFVGLFIFFVDIEVNKK